MPLAVKVDEDLPIGVANVLTAAGYDASTVHGQGMTGFSDERLWDAVQTEGRLIITADKGFANIRVNPPGSHHGVILLRLDEESRRGYMDLVQRLLATTSLDALAGAISVVTPDRIRVRRA